MATTLLPPTAAPKPVSGDVRFVAVRANLLPDEVISTRQVEVVRKRVIAGLIAFVVLLIGWYGVSWWQTKSANGKLDDAQRHGVALQSQQNQYGPLVNAQREIDAVKTQLQSLMTGDLSWKTMLTTLRAKAPAGVKIASVDGSVDTALTVGASSTAGSAVLNQTGSPAVGELTVSGDAPDKRTVAAYADQLATVPGLTAPLVSSVQAEDHGVTFTITAVITSDALGGRYAASATSPTGGN